MILRSTAEPVLTDEDVRVWESWMRAAETHAKTRAFARRVDTARRVVDEAVTTAERWSVMWSAGKDSTVMTHLVCVDRGLPVDVASEKDDLDYPGEREYVEQLAAQWGLRLTILPPPISPRAWVAEHAHEIDMDGDFHSRAAALSKACFYDVVETHGQDFDGIFLGLRKDESKGRLMNRVTHGLLYRKRPTKRHAEGQWVATPLGDWTGLDVYAYAVSREIPLLLVYRCVAFMHADEPWRVRKSWWLPQDGGRRGGVAWLRRYYPSLHRQFTHWIPMARLHG